jgi:uncharacterized membrane protein
MFFRRLSLLGQSTVYLLSGANHFLHASFYLRIMPDHYSHPLLLVHVSGIAELIGGMGLLVSRTRRFSAAGIALMLLVFLDVHVFMIRHAEQFPDVPVSLLWARIPLQLVLIAWALLYARRRDS